MGPLQWKWTVMYGCVPFHGVHHVYTMQTLPSFFFECEFGLSMPHHPFFPPFFVFVTFPGYIYFTLSLCVHHFWLSFLGLILYVPSLPLRPFHSVFSISLSPFSFSLTHPRFLLFPPLSLPLSCFLTTFTECITSMHLFLFRLHQT